jgi:F-type H+-transporting ATPase subunit delta
VRAAVRGIIEGKPRGYIGILEHFQRLVKLAVEQRTARVESAVPLPADLQAFLQTGLTKAYGAGLKVTFGQKPELIGGLRIKVGSDVYDGSVRAKLAALQEGF